MFNTVSVTEENARNTIIACDRLEASGLLTPADRRARKKAQRVLLRAHAGTSGSISYDDGQRVPLMNQYTGLVVYSPGIMGVLLRVTAGFLLFVLALYVLYFAGSLVLDAVQGLMARPY